MGEEEMPSGEDAEAAASKLRARMRGKAARQEVADLKASKEATEADAPAGAGGAGTAEEEEEMPSGEDAEAAASKLQARMRGKAARQEVADLKASKEATEADAPRDPAAGA